MLDWVINAAHYIIPFILLLGILVFVHEFGHFIVARMCGVGVTDFSIGFGKELYSFTDRYKTKWKICAVPLGGYCQFLGDMDAASTASEDGDKKAAALSEEDKKHAFPYQNPYKKLAIVLGGPGSNYLFAIVVLTIMFATLGKFSIPPVVGEVVPDGAAAQAGIMVDDRILEINHRPIETFTDVSTEVALTTENSAWVKLQRKEEILEFEVPLKEMEVEANGQNTKRRMLGIKSKGIMQPDLKKMSVSGAFVEACAETWRVTEGTLRGVGQMITGKRGSEDLGGIIRIAEMSGDISKKDGFLDLISFMVLLSINLGLINLFPIPVLDGGHVVILSWEIVTRHEMSIKVKEIMFKTGFALIMALMLLATWNDIVHLFHRFF